MDMSLVVVGVQTVILTIIVPFTIYYVKNHSPYMYDKQTIETRLVYIENNVASIDGKVDQLLLR